MINPSIQLITIIGPTASGKTALALDLAQRFDGEIICADSRTLYRGMDIGTAKPTRAEQARVPHHLLDVLDPGEVLSAAAFKTLAEGAITDIAGRGRVPFLVGGSGLYIDAVLFDYQFPKPADPGQRAELETMSLRELQELVLALNPEAAASIDTANPRRLIRAIETRGHERSRSTAVREQTLVLGLSMNKKIAQDRISKRIEKMLEEGFIEEVARVGAQWGWDNEAMSSIGYRAFKDVVLGHKSTSEGAADFALGDMRLVKKQTTWFKRNPTIQWLDRPADAVGLVEAFLRPPVA